MVNDLCQTVRSLNFYCLTNKDNIFGSINYNIFNNNWDKLTMGATQILSELTKDSSNKLQRELAQLALRLIDFHLSHTSLHSDNSIATCTIDVEDTINHLYGKIEIWLDLLHILQLKTESFIAVECIKSTKSFDTIKSNKSNKQEHPRPCGECKCLSRSYASWNVLADENDYDLDDNNNSIASDINDDYDCKYALSDCNDHGSLGVQGEKSTIDVLSWLTDTVLSIYSKVLKMEEKNSNGSNISSSSSIAKFFELQTTLCSILSRSTILGKNTKISILSQSLVAVAGKIESIIVLNSKFDDYTFLLFVCKYFHVMIRFFNNYVSNINSKDTDTKSMWNQQLNRLSMIIVDICNNFGHNFHQSIQNSLLTWLEMFKTDCNVAEYFAKPFNLLFPKVFTFKSTNIGKLNSNRMPLRLPMIMIKPIDPNSIPPMNKNSNVYLQSSRIGQTYMIDNKLRKISFNVVKNW